MVTYKANTKNGHPLVYTMTGIFVLLALLALVGCGQKETAQTTPDLTVDSLPSLQAALDTHREAIIKQIPENVLSVMGAAQQELAASGITGSALNVGDTIPSFTLINAEGQAVEIASILHTGPAIITFYRGGWCPYCNLQLAAYQDIMPQVKEINASLVAISPEQPDSSLSTKERKNLDFIVLSDPDNMVARQFNIVFTLTPAIQNIYQQFNIDLEAYNKNQHNELPLGATYVVDQNGIITYAFVDVDYTKRAEPATLLAELTKLSE